LEPQSTVTIEARVGGALTDFNGDKAARKSDPERVQIWEEQRRHDEM